MQMNRQRAAAAAALATAIAVPAEGLRRYAYYDPPAVLTVCYGHTGKDVVKGRQYSDAECRSLLMQDMGNAVASVEVCNPGLPLPVLAAFADAVYNLGPTIACNDTKSTAARMLLAKDYRGACNQLIRWNKAVVGGMQVELPGLTKRRIAERDLCLSGAS